MNLLSRWCRETSLMGKELLVLDGEDLVDKEIDVIDEDCFVHCPPI
jgi:hypothetical protein